jgi:hypothetical protein
MVKVAKFLTLIGIHSDFDTEKFYSEGRGSYGQPTPLL